MERISEIERKTRETQIQAMLKLEGQGQHQISTGIGFFDHMLTLFSVHGLFDLSLTAVGDIEVDFHHTVEDVGLVLGDLLCNALGERKGIQRYGNAIIPMDDALTNVAVDLSNRPYCVMRMPDTPVRQNEFDASLTHEFFRAFSQHAGMNLHVQIVYGTNWHHMVEAAFKGLGRALRQAVMLDPGVSGVPSSKGVL